MTITVNNWEQLHKVCSRLWRGYMRGHAGVMLAEEKLLVRGQVRLQSYKNGRIWTIRKGPNY